MLSEDSNDRAISSTAAEGPRRAGSDEKQVTRLTRDSVASAPAVVAPCAQAATKPSKGIILRSGRIRLPDKLIQYLNNEVTPSLFWQPDGQGFSIDCDKIQSELLDQYFHGTKLSSFLRSLNRWGFKRLFYHSMPKSTLSFHHPLFCKGNPDLCKDMNMAPCSGGAGTIAAEAKKKAKAAKVAKTESKPLSDVPAQAPPRQREVVNPPVPIASSQFASNSTAAAAVVAAPLAPAAIIISPQPLSANSSAPTLDTVADQGVLRALLQHSNGPSSSGEPRINIFTSPPPIAQAQQPRPAVVTSTIAPTSTTQPLQAQATMPLTASPDYDALLGQIRNHTAMQQVATGHQRNVLQNSALLAQTMPQNPLDILEGVLSSLVNGGQQQVTARPSLHQFGVMASAAPPSLVALPIEQQQQAAPTASLLQLLTPSQQLAVLNQLAVVKNSGANAGV